MDPMAQLQGFVALLMSSGKLLEDGEGPDPNLGALIYRVKDAGKANTIQALLVQLGINYTVHYDRKEREQKPGIRNAAGYTEQWMIIAHIPEACLRGDPEWEDEDEGEADD